MTLSVLTRQISDSANSAHVGHCIVMLHLTILDCSLLGWRSDIKDVDAKHTSLIRGGCKKSIGEKSKSIKMQSDSRFERSGPTTGDYDRIKLPSPWKSDECPAGTTIISTPLAETPS